MSHALPSRWMEFAEESGSEALNFFVRYHEDTSSGFPYQSRNSCIICANSATSGVSTSFVLSVACLFIISHKEKFFVIRPSITSSPPNLSTGWTVPNFGFFILFNTYHACDRSAIGTFLFCGDVTIFCAIVKSRRAAAVLYEH